MAETEYNASDSNQEEARDEKSTKKPNENNQTEAKTHHKANKKAANKTEKNETKEPHIKSLKSEGNEDSKTRHAPNSSEETEPEKSHSKPGKTEGNKSSKGDADNANKSQKKTIASKQVPTKRTPPPTAKATKFEQPACTGIITSPTYKHCIIKDVLCAAECATISHATLNLLCTKFQGVSNQGGCPSEYVCPAEADQLLKKDTTGPMPTGFSSELGTVMSDVAATVLDASDLKFYGKTSSPGVCGNSASVTGALTGM